MNRDWQYWLSRTALSHQSFGGARLKFVPDSDQGGIGSDPKGGSVEFDFARLPDDAALRPQLPPLRVFPPSIDIEQTSYESPYHLLKSNNQSLRVRHPEVDLPKSLLFDFLHEDQTQIGEVDPNRSTLAGFDIDSRSSLIVSAGGSLGNHLYLSHLVGFYDSNSFSTLEVPQFRATSQPAIVFRTPVQQVLSWPFLEYGNAALFVARTYDSTNLITCPCPNESGDWTLSDRPELSQFTPIFQLRTTDTDRTGHIDSCVSNPINENPSFVTLDEQGRIWRSKTDGSSVAAFCLGQTRIPSYEEEGTKKIDWGRCGIYPTNDCLVVAHRKYMNLVDHRMDDGIINLYRITDNNPITDMQRYINHQTAHLRMFCTTSCIIGSDDRKPGIPLFKIEHFRQHDLSLKMTHPSPIRFDSDAGSSRPRDEERVEELVLWSQKNDIASVYRLKSQVAVPPNLLGQPLGMPLISSSSQNPRIGLLMVGQKTINSQSKTFSLVEMTRDGALWHQELSLGQPFGNVSKAEMTSESSRCFWDSGVETMDLNSRLSGEDELKGVLAQVEHCPNFETMCEEFSSALILGEQKDEAPGPISLPFSHFHDPLSYCSESKTSEPPQSDPPQSQVINSRSQLPVTTPTQSRIDISSTFNHFLLESYPTGSDQTPRDAGTSLKSHNQSQAWLESSIRSSLLIKKPPEGQVEKRNEGPGRTEVSTMVKNLIAPWKIGASPFEHEWSKFVSETNDPGRAELAEPEKSLDTPNLGSQTRQRPKPRRVSPEKDENPVNELLTVKVGRALRQPSKNHINVPRGTATDSFGTDSPNGRPSENLVTASQDPMSNWNDDSQDSQMIFSQDGQNNNKHNNNVFSQILPGKHGGRNSIKGRKDLPAKKKKRLGGF